VLTHLTVLSIFLDLSHLDHVLSIYLNFEVILKRLLRWFVYQPFCKYISSNRKDTQSIPPLDTKQGTTTESDVDKAEALNDQFTGVFTKKAHDQVPSLERKIQKMKDIRITEWGVLKLLQSLNISKARGPDEISPKILKELSKLLYLVLCREAEYSEYLFYLMIYTCKMVCCFLWYYQSCFQRIYYEMMLFLI
jgi:hypothetical protein